MTQDAIVTMVNAMRNQAISLVQQAEAILQVLEAETAGPEKPTCKDCKSKNLQTHSMMGGASLTVCNDCGKDQAE